jgi:hypothetical protein
MARHRARQGTKRERRKKKKKKKEEQRKKKKGIGHFRLLVTPVGISNDAASTVHTSHTVFIHPGPEQMDVA